MERFEAKRKNRNVGLSCAVCQEFSEWDADLSELSSIESRDYSFLYQKYVELRSMNRAVRCELDIPKLKSVNLPFYAFQTVANSIIESAFESLAMKFRCFRSARLLLQAAGQSGQRIYLPRSWEHSASSRAGGQGGTKAGLDDRNRSAE